MMGIHIFYCSASQKVVTGCWGLIDRLVIHAQGASIIGTPCDSIKGLQLVDFIGRERMKGKHSMELVVV